MTTDYTTTRILIIGNLPPPLGGVTVYVERRLQQLIKQGFAVDIFPSNPSVSNLIQQLPHWLKQHYSVIELNSIRPIWPLLLKLFFPRSQLLLIDHNNSKRFAHYGWWQRLLTSVALRWVDQIDLVHPQLAQNYTRFIAARTYPFGYRDPFLAPNLDDGPRLRAQWPKVIQQFIAKPGPLLVSCASDLYLEQDIYRFLFCMRVFAEVLKTHPTAHLLLVGSRCSAAYHQAIQDLINELALSEQLLFTQETMTLWPLFTKAQLLLRLTSADGDSITIREALSFACPVLATDCVPRPEGVHLVGLDQFDATVASINQRLETKPSI